MTTVEYGGGPTVEQRRMFAGLKDGTMVPGYRGYCPQLKYSFGKTYSQDTYELNQGRQTDRPIIVPSSEPPILSKRLLNSSSCIPDSNGDNKYTTSMVPGYTGYIPKWPFKFGSTYAEECEICLNEHFTDRHRKECQKQDLSNSLRSFPRLQSRRFDPDVKNHLNMYADHLGKKSGKRPFSEPPIPGYTGYVPRVHTTELGLGCRYQEMSKNGLESFLIDMARHKQSLNENVPKCSTRTERENLAMAYEIENNEGPSESHKRLYKQDGMIPRYTGFLPQRRYHFGNTYGDTSRSLDVCAHNADCYGTFIKTAKRSAMLQQS
jgi:hypothetical protein